MCSVAATSISNLQTQTLLQAEAVERQALQLKQIHQQAADLTKLEDEKKQALHEASQLRQAHEVGLDIKRRAFCLCARNECSMHDCAETW